MENVLNYINTITQAILGIDLLETPSALINFLGGLNVPEVAPLSWLVATIAQNPVHLTSAIIWTLITSALITVALVIPWKIFKKLTRGLD